MITTLIVDDSPLVRSIIRDFLESDGSFEIIGEGENGLDGVTKAKNLLPQLITMDIEMPVMNGLDAIEEIIKGFNTAIVVISTNDTAKTAYDATVRGAMEFFAKDIFTSQMTEQKRLEILTAFKHIVEIKKRITSHQKISRQTVIAPRQINCIVIAASTGGPMALCQLCSSLPDDFSVPIILVQHNTSGFDIGFVQWLDGYTGLNVKIAENGTIPVKGYIYVAPTDRHLVVSSSGIEFDDSEPVHNQKPAADILFKSAASLYKNSLISVVLTGIGDDGADGSCFVKKAGGITIAQDEASSMVFGMPQAAAQTGCIDLVLPLGDIAQKLVFLTKGA
jgi:two-component system chemotaxis response regulator CheB